MASLSVLDLAPIVEGSSVGESLQNSLDLARHCEKWGYRRFWLAEHHNLGSVASAATAVVIGHVAAGTSTIRVGAGGIMLPNHAPLLIAEQFGTLDALYPGRIDLGVGRAPGTDGVTSYALRRNLQGDVDAFPRDVVELLGYLDDPEPDQRVRAVPGAGSHVPVWILGSSLFGAELAAALGLPYAFASHFAPAQLSRALDLYRSRFRPSKHLARPHTMAGFNVFAGDSDEEGQLLFTSAQQAFANLRRGKLGPIPPPRANFERELSPHERAGIDEALSCSAVGSPDAVRQGLSDFIRRTGVDEVIIASMIHDHKARVRSYEIAAEAHRALAT